MIAYDSPFSPSARPVFFASRQNGKIHFRGDAKHAFGHKIPSAGSNSQGVYAEWNWDGRVLTFENDRHGFYPIFLYHKPGVLGISPSLAELMRQGVDTDLDYSALAVALRLGQFIGDDTPFRYIRVLPPNARLVWDGKTLTIGGGYQFQPAIASISRSAAINTYLELFRKSIIRRSPPTENFAVPLSGGRDSRHIVFELVRSGLRPAFCVTLTLTPEDVRVASLICDTLGLPHRTIAQAGNPLIAEAQKNWATNLGVDEGSYPLAIADSLMDEGVIALYDGIAGDVLSAGLFLGRTLCDAFRTESLANVARRILPPDQEVVLQQIVTPNLLRLCRPELAVERLCVELARHADAHNPVTSFFFWNRTRRKIALTPYAMMSSIPHVFSPYLDSDLVEFLMSLSADFLMDHSFHTEAIQSGFPEWAHIPFESKTATTSYDTSSKRARFARELAGFAIKDSPTEMLTSGFLRKESLYPRLLRSLVSASFGASQFWYFQRAVWMHQLESLVRFGQLHSRALHEDSYLSEIRAPASPPCQ